MKKILSLLLVLCMIITSCVLFSSCAKVSTKDVEKDPQATLSEAIQNTSASFFTDETNANKVIDEALKSGSISVLFESPDLLGGLITKIGETIYFDGTNQKYVSDTNVTMNGEDMNARIFLDKNGVILNSSAVLGSDKSYALNFATLIDQLDESVLAQMAGLNEEALKSVTDAVTMIKDSFDQAAEENTEESKKLINDYLALLSQTVAQEKLENADGKNEKYVVATYVLNNTTVKAIAEKAIADTDLDETAKTEAKADIEETLANVTLDLSVKLYIHQKENQVSKVTVSGTVLDKETNETATVSAEITFSATEIKLTASVTGVEEPMSATVKLTKEDSKESVTYKISVDGSQGSVSVNLFNAAYTYTKADGAIVLSADVYSEEGERSKFELTGKVTVTDTEASLEFNSLKMDDVTVTFKLVISAKKGGEIPATPTDAKDIVTMTQADWMTFMTEFQNSKVGKLIFGQMN